VAVVGGPALLMDMDELMVMRDESKGDLASRSVFDKPLDEETTPTINRIYIGIRREMSTIAQRRDPLSQ